MEDRYSNMMNIPTTSEGSRKAVYYYVKPTIENSKVTFADGSVHWEKVLYKDKRLWFSSEKENLYLDEACTKLANVTRKEKIEQCKKAGLI
ncbi:hypothetical protein C6W19_24250 [Bacillus sp. RJGP41]|nr:hypothetical protein C6W19_24250 [Bacillus sp. RJGP41]